MPGLNILLTTYSTSYLSSGGGEVEMFRFSQLLRLAGANTDIYGPSSRPISYYDFAIHFSVEQSGIFLFDELRKVGKKVFLYPNVWWLQPPSLNEIERIGAMVKNAEKVIFKSRVEYEHFAKFIFLPFDKALIIKVAISSSFAQDIDKDLALTYVEKPGYALCIGLIEPIKNQLQVIRALNSIDMNGVFIGGIRDEAYAKQCKKEAGPNIIFLPFISPSSALLTSILINASVVVEPSFDPPGRSVMEAALLMKPVIMGYSEWQKEHFPQSCWTVNPESFEDIARGIVSALSDANASGKVIDAKKSITETHIDNNIAPSLLSALLK